MRLVALGVADDVTCKYDDVTCTYDDRSVFDFFVVLVGLVSLVVGMCI